jgi:hypothetical protein
MDTTNIEGRCVPASYRNTEVRILELFTRIVWEQDY